MDGWIYRLQVFQQETSREREEKKTPKKTVREL